MKKKLICMKHLLGMAGLLALAPAVSSAQSYVVNEFFFSGTTLTTGADYIEVVLLKDFTAAQLNGTVIGDSQTAKNTKQGYYTLQNMGSIAATFRRGTIIAIGGTTTITSTDTTYSPSTGDWNIVLPTTATTYLTAGGSSPDIATNDVVWVDDSTTSLQVKSNVGFSVDLGAGAMGTFNNAVQTPAQTGSSVSVGAVTSGNAVQLMANLAGAYQASNWTLTGSGSVGLPNGGANTRWIDSLRGQIIATDDASDALYTGGNFNGVNGGSGWGAAWAVDADISGFEGTFAGNSASNLAGSFKPNWDINTATNNRSWGMYANTSNLAQATRSFPAALATGQEFRFSLDNGSVQAGGTVGVSFRNASDQNVLEIFFVGGNTNYTLSDSAGSFDSGFGFTSDGIDLVLKPTGGTNYQLLMTRRNGSVVTFNRSLSTPAGGSAITKARFFNFNSGSGSNADAYFNAIGIDDPRPGLVSINRAASDPTNAGTVNYTVTFDESVSSLSAASFSVTATGGQGTASVGTPTGSGLTWTVPVSTAATSGTVRLDVTAQGTAVDVASNPLRGLPYTSGQVYTIDKDAPTGTLNVASGATYTTTGTVNLGLSFSDSGGASLSQMQFSNDGSSYSTLESYATSKSGWALVAGDGPKTVYTRVTDTAGNTSTAVTDTIVLDGTAPTASTFSINSGATYATSTSATANVSASDATSGLAQVQVDSDNNGSFETTGAYAASSAFTLPGGDGSKTVVVRFTDNAGNVSSTLSDSITLDTTVPVGTSVSINGGATYTNSLSSTLTVAATDATSGVADMRFSNDGSSYGSYSAYNTSAAWSLAAGADGVRTVSALFRDNAGLPNVTAVSDTIIYDATLPSGSISVDGGATYATSTGVNLTLSASDATAGVAQMQFSNDGSSYSSLEAYGTSKSWTLATGDGAKTVYVRYTDNAGNISGITAISDGITLDGTAPTGSVSIDGGASYVGSTAVTLTLSATDATAGVAQMQFSNDGSSYSSLEAYGTSKSWTLTTGDGAKTVYVRYTDAAGNITGTTAISDGITLDTTAPTGSIAINSGATYTGSTSASLTLSASDAGSGVSQMQFSNDGTSFSALEPFSTSKSWALAPGDGAKTVYVRYADALGNITGTTAISDGITLDTTAPSGTLAINGGSFTGSTAVTLTLSASDAGAGVAQMQFSNDGTSFSTLEAYGTSKSWTLASGDGPKTVYVRYTDSVGNITGTTAISDSVTLDTTAPTGSVAISGGAFTGSTAVTLNLSASDTGAGVAQMQFSNDGTSFSTLEAYGTTKSWTLATGDGAKTVYVRYTDSVGNITGATAISDSVTLDTTAPTGSIVINGGAAFTNNTAATLTLSASDAGIGVAQMQFSNDGSAFSSLESYATSKSWTLASGDGAKTVYVRYSDALGNVSGATAISSGITLDTVAPASSASVAAATLVGTSVTVGSTTSDGSVALFVSTPSNASFVNTGLTASAGSFTYTAAESGLFRFYTVATDAAGNVESAPAGFDDNVVVNIAPNGAVPLAVSAAGPYTFPMEAGLDVTLDFTSIVGGPGTVTVSREEAPSFPSLPGDLNPAAVITERLVITQSGLTSFVTDLDWTFQNANLNGLTAGNIDMVYRYNGATRVATYPVTAVGNTLTVTGINGFSQFYAGDDSATSVGEWMLLND